MVGGGDGGFGWPGHNFNLILLFYTLLFFIYQYQCIDGSVVEFSPATREARVRFPVNANFGSCLPSRMVEKILEIALSLRIQDEM